MRGIRLWIFCLIAGTIVTGLIMGLVTRSPAGPLLTARLAVPPTSSSALPILAHHRNLFASAGTAVDLSMPGAGRDCVELLRKGQVDLAVAYDTPIVRAILDGQDLVFLSELHNAKENTVVVYRKDRGIVAVRDLVGKRFGFVPGTNGEFFLELFLKAHVIERDSLEIIPYELHELSAELSSGRIDAAVLWEPEVSSHTEVHPDTFASFNLPFYSEVSFLVTSRSYAKDHPREIDQVISALVNARSLLLSEPDESFTAVSGFLEKRGINTHPQAWQNMNFGMGFSNMMQTLVREEMIWYSRKRAQPAPPETFDVINYLELAPILRHLPEWVAVQ